MVIDFFVNGRPVSLETDPARRLVDALSESLGLTQTTAGCYSGECGTCTVLLDGKLVHSCLTPMFAVRKATVTTIEGIDATRTYRELVRGFREANCTPCRFCYQGKLLSLYHILETIDAPTKSEIDEVMMAHRCRCTDYTEIAEMLGGIIVQRRKRQRAALI